ncbi:DUF5304 family protein [Streptomyces sp. RFCAC02]|uniref:DUF5304 family protein n=1 Tax=Streptomyces sp. RFCAC02 TaxID=2499143 RepID=UPI001021DC47|nr:DUF5304 family protein [Streptomyces sp. RFCAC02]
MHDDTAGGAPGQEPGGERPDPDAWATAAEEDLRAERARRRARAGAPPGDAAEEFRRLADAVTDRLTELGLGAATGPLAARARAVLEPVVERNAEAFQHLANAGQELLAAYRAAALSQEGRWTRAAQEPDRPGTAGPRDGAGRTGGGTDGADSGTDSGTETGGAGSGDGGVRGEGDDGPSGAGPSQRIDLD